MPVPRSSPATARAADTPVTARILAKARAHFFQHGYSAFTMDDLATELGMSKKTLYVHFAGKDEILRSVIDELSREIRAEAEALLAQRQLNFAEKLRGFAEGMVTRLSRLHPATMRDLERFAPELHQQLAAMREQNIPYIFGRFIEDGQLAGMVRPDLDVGFAVQFFLKAMQGLTQPATMERLALSPRDILPRAIDLFFGGMLTPAGRKEHEKLFAR